MPNINPLLQHWDLPPWSTVRAEHLVAAIEKIIADNRQAIASIVATQSAFPPWDDLVLAIDETDARLSEAQSIIYTLDTVKPGGESWSKASAVCDDIIARYRAEKMANSALFNAYQMLAQSTAAKLFDPSRKTVLNKILRKFRLSGIELTDDQQKEFARLNLGAGALEGLFLNQLNSANTAWSKRIDDVKQLDGLAQDAQDRFALNARHAGHDGWLLVLDEATYHLVMSHAEDRALREEYFFAYCTRASDQGPHADEFDNAPVLQLLLAKRHRKAELLGFENYAQLSLMNRMAESTDQVRQFLRRQIVLEAPAFEQETLAVADFAITQGLLKVEPWDHEFLVQKIRQRQLGHALRKLRTYFPLDGTLRRLCLFSERMFGIQITEQKSFDRWHASVRLFEISEHGQLIGHIYVDPYHRKEAPDFAFTATLRNRRMDAEGKVTQPIAILHGNFSRGKADQPFLLAHRDLRILFHEFGHCLQHVLT
jgi:oligopeptidase A